MKNELDDLANINFEPIWNHDYSKYFRTVQYNGKVLSNEERKLAIVETDNTIAQYSSGLPLLRDMLEQSKDLHDEYHEVERVIVSLSLFTTMTAIDIMVANKFFLLADKDYDRRFMRGKLAVILNEGFKRLYGFNDTTRNKSEWNRLEPLMKYFPDIIKQQYLSLTGLLERHANSYSWWKNVRDTETHIDALSLYDSRQEEIIESKVIMESLMLFDTLLAVSQFLEEANKCLLNYLVDLFHRGQLKQE